MPSSTSSDVITVHGIKNCDTVKKALKWLDEKHIKYEFRDYKKSGADAAVLETACRKFGWEKVVNRQGMTWRKLSEADKSAITDDESAITLMHSNTSVIKRPIITKSNDLQSKNILLGFDTKEYESYFKKEKI
ncbi:unnamed protein product [Amoebophrya sp. A25]|nr:unnamed protein product [Amoebophrya sp. A25]|eukprot:GSA25T00010989001.1